MDQSDDEEAVGAQVNSDSQNNVNSGGLKRKKDSPSPVWECSTKTGKTAKCNYCEKTWEIEDGNTSNIRRHLESVHRNEDKVKIMTKAYEVLSIEKRNRDNEKKKKLNNSTLTSFGFTKRTGSTMDPKVREKITEEVVKHLIEANRPFSDVNVPSFRRMLYTLNPDYICVDRTTAVAKFDKLAVAVKENLSKEIQDDVNSRELTVPIISIITDHGTSQDILRTKKNVVIVTWTNSKFELKVDTLGLIPSIGSQTSLQIKTDVFSLLKKELSLDSSWKINWVTDGASNVVKARCPTSYVNVGLYVNFDGTCADHTLELVCEDSLKHLDQAPLRETIQKMKTFVNHINKSSPDRQQLAECVSHAGMSAKTTVKGTSNRFFTKYFEVKRFLELIEPINQFIEEFTPDTVDAFSPEEIKLLETYRSALQLIVKSSVILEGEKYVTASSVIPFLDGIYEDLMKMDSGSGSEGRTYFSRLVNLEN